MEGFEDSLIVSMCETGWICHRLPHKAGEHGCVRGLIAMFAAGYSSANSNLKEHDAQIERKPT